MLELPVPVRSTARLALALTLCPALALAAPDPPAVDVAHAGQDLVISWSPVAPPLDGYRVYKAQTLNCDDARIVYEGPATSYTDAGAFLDPTIAMYAVSAYAGSEESGRTGPVYKWVTTPPSDPIGSLDPLLSLPENGGPADSLALCLDFNPDRPDSPVDSIVRVDLATGLFQVQSCTATPLPPVFQLVPGDAYLVQIADDTQGAVPTLYPWGLGDASLERQFSRLFEPAQAPDCERGVHWVSLPYDHAYSSLSEVAAEIPTAVRVAIFGPGGLQCPEYYLGLQRPSSSDPWSGFDLPLETRRSEGLIIAVDAPATWTPRRQCAPLTGPGRVNQPPLADAGGPYDPFVCATGIIGIWLDGDDSRDLDSSGPLTYQWSTTCAGDIFTPDQPTSPAHFDCSPCAPLDCTVSLTVTDPDGASDTDVVPVTSHADIGCLQAGNSLRLTRSGDETSFDWSEAPQAESYLLLSDDTPALSSPAGVACGPEKDFRGTASAGVTLDYFSVDGLSEDCGR